MLKIIQADALTAAWIWMKGPDARDFLHRLSTANIKTMQPGFGARSCFLTATGKIRSYHTIWCISPSEFALELDAGSTGTWDVELLKLIDELTFTEKFSVTRWTEATSIRLLGSDTGKVAADLKPFETRELRPGVRAFNSGDVDFGESVLEIRGDSVTIDEWRRENIPSASMAIGMNELESLRIKAVRPKADSEITHEANPLEIGLIEALPRGKGCYPGQEVIERTISIGAPARRLVLIEADVPKGKSVARGASVFAEQGSVGVVTSIEAAGSRLLALVKKSHASEGSNVAIESAADSHGQSDQSNKIDGIILKLSPLPADDI